ncbi:unnamed protein product [Peniophora sp. CBMAI 1063]|nr:unnamed protein product [Peniophora sp. CBMAI 1063]
MCNLDTEGTQHGCGHYVITKKLRKNDCGSRWCAASVAHPKDCRNCQCDKFLGPDASETITCRTDEYCSTCHYWYRGPGRAIRAQ